MTYDLRGFEDIYDPVVFDLEDKYHGWDTHYNALFYAIIHRNTKRFYEDINFFQNGLMKNKAFKLNRLDLLKFEPEKLKYRKADP